jgi:nucleotide-binding universal stress UspA family protein
LKEEGNADLFLLFLNPILSIENVLFVTDVLILELAMMFDRIRIVVGYDNSLQSKKALDEAITLAKCFSGFIKVVNVYEKDKKQEANEAITFAEKQLKEGNVKHECVSVPGSNPAKTLVSVAKKENFSLIVVGSRGLGGGVSMLLGSVSKQVVSHANGNVLVVKK